MSSKRGYFILSLLFLIFYDFIGISSSTTLNRKIVRCQMISYKNLSCSDIVVTAAENELYIENSADANSIEIRNSSMPIFPSLVCENCSELNVFKASGCNIAEIQENTFPERNNIFLLDLSDNKIGILHNNVLKHVKKLTNLNLRNNSIGEIELDAFLYCYSLTILDLSENLISDTSTIDLSDSYLIKTLMLAKNQIKSIQFLNNPEYRKLETLDLSYNLIETFEDTQFETTYNLTALLLKKNLIKIVRIQQSFHKLETLDLSGNQIETIDSTFLRYFPILTSLRLGQNKIQNINFLLNSNVLRYLDLNSNPIQHNSGQPFRDLWNLIYLNLSSTSVDGVGIHDFHNLRDLEVLDLSSNNFRTFFMENIIPIYKLRSLLLDNNQLTEINYHMMNFTAQLKFGIRNNDFRCSYLRNLIRICQDKGYHLLLSKHEIMRNDSFSFGIECLQTDMEYDDDDVNDQDGDDSSREFVEHSTELPEGSGEEDQDDVNIAPHLDTDSGKSENCNENFCVIFQEILDSYKQNSNVNMYVTHALLIIIIVLLIILLYKNLYKWRGSWKNPEHKYDKKSGDTKVTVHRVGDEFDVKLN